jgi:hypothetical protein
VKRGGRDQPTASKGRIQDRSIRHSPPKECQITFDLVRLTAYNDDAEFSSVECAGPQ